MGSIDSNTTALLIIDPQNDFLSEDGVVWDLVGDGVVKNNVVEKLKNLIARAKEAGVDVFYSPHYYDKEFDAWKNNNPIDSLMFERKMFDRNSSGSEFHPELAPDDATIICAPHKILSGFHTSDLAIQMRKRDIKTNYRWGMSESLGEETHPTDAEKNDY